MEDLETTTYHDFYAQVPYEEIIKSADQRMARHNSVLEQLSKVLNEPTILVGHWHEGYLLDQNGERVGIYHEDLGECYTNSLGSRIRVFMDYFKIREDLLK